MTSKAITAHNSIAIKRLIAEGIIPHECRKMTLIVDANSVIVMQLEVFVTNEQIDKIADALADNPDEAKAFAREIIFREPVRDKTAKVNLP